MAFNYKTEYERYRRYYQSLEPVLKKPTARNYTMAIFSFLAVSLFGWYGIRPTIQTILFLRREIADNQIVSHQMEDKITHLVEAQAAYQDAANQLLTIDQALPQDPNVLSLVAQLKNLAAGTDSSLSAVQVSAVPLLPSVTTGNASAPQTGKLTEVPLVVVAIGSYTKLKAFLDGIINMRRIFAIDTIGIASSKEEVFGTKLSTASGTLLRMVIHVNGYYMPIKKTQ